MLSTALLLIYAVLPLSAWGWCRKKKVPLVLGLVGTLLGGYLVYVGGSVLYGMELERELYAYDLDGDGGFSESELTPEARAAMKKFTTDTGRSLAPIVAIPVTIVWVGVQFGLLELVRWVLSRRVPPMREPNRS